MSSIPEILMKVLVCPVDLGELVENPGRGELVCSVCGQAYPVRDGIPVMLLPEDRQTEARRNTDAGKLLRNTRR